MELLDIRIREIALIKAVLAAVVLTIMLLTFRYALPLAVSIFDLAFVPVYVWLARRWPKPATYLLIAETALALTPRQFVQGYVNGINWVFYIPLPLAAAYVIATGRALWNASLLVTLIAVPVMLLALLNLPAHIERQEVFTLAAYLLVVLWGVAWLGSKFLKG